MAAYDDRPISVYDNLSTTPAMHTSTPKAKPHTNTTTTTSTSTTPTSASSSSTNGAALSPYSEISFKFNDNNQPHHPQLLPNGDRCLHLSQQQQQTDSNQVHPTSACYATPFKSTTPSNATTATASILKSPSPPVATIAVNVNPAHRPLSQHSQSELNEASQSIAAVKAALNDAKSKFFGLNGYAPDNINTSIVSQSQPHHPKVQIVTTPSRTQPKYQNIPENSAIFRSQSPPKLPPKPSEQRLHFNSSDLNAANTPSPTSASPLSCRITIEPSTQTPKMSTSLPPPTSNSPVPAAQAKVLPHATYKQIPLNDIEISQPSQAVYMSTTVPQNIKGSKIAGRHTPTRNSLRHSRMLVGNNKNYQALQYPNPMNFKQPNLARWLLIMQIIIGLLLAVLAVWIFLLAPNTAVQDNPYWSGLALLLAGTVGLVLIRYRRIKRHKVRENCFIFLRADSYFLSLVAVLLCCVALICASIHFARLTASDTRCESSNMLLKHGSCSCTFNANDVQASNSTDHSTGRLVLQEVQDYQDNSYKVEYRELSCSEVNGEFTYILGVSIVLNALGFIISIVYIVLLACYRHNSKRFYASVHTSTF